MSSINIHILGAGKPFKGLKSNALRNATDSMKVLDWQLQELNIINAKINYIGGYKYDEIIQKYPNLNFKINPLWELSGPVTSVLQSISNDSNKNIFCYGDILFQSNTIKSLITSKKDISIAIDKGWKNRYKNRSEDNLRESEKVKLKGLEIKGIGSRVRLNEAGAEFAGIVCFSNKVSLYLKNNINEISKIFKNKSLVDLIDNLINLGFSIEGFDVKNQWAELNNSNDLINFIFGTKAQTLKQLSKFLVKSKIEDQYCFTVKEWLINSKKILKAINKKFEADKLVIRSSSKAEDNFETANAGKFKSILNVNKNSINEIKDAIDQVINSYKDNISDNQVLIQQMVLNTKISGVIFTHNLSTGSPYYFINYDESGDTESITSGKSTNSSTIIISRKYIKSDLNLIPKLMENLLPAISEIEDLLDFSFLDIEFAITEDKVIHLFQVRPMAIKYEDTDIDDIDIFTLIDRASEDFKEQQIAKPFVLGDYPIYGLMPDWNPAEIIGTKPSRLAFTLYCYLITDEIWAKQRSEYGYRDLRPNKLIRLFAGQPFVDVRASINSFIPSIIDNYFAEKLINFYSKWLIAHPDLHDKLEFEVLPTCFSLDFYKWEDRLTKFGSFSKSEIKTYKIALKNITINGIKRINNDLKLIKKIELRYKKIINSKTKNIDKALMLLDECKELGTLPFAHIARAAFISISILKSAVQSAIISEDAFNSFLSSVKTVSHEFTDDLQNLNKSNKKDEWGKFLNKYGHLRPGTYDITSLSYFEAKDKYLSKDNKFNLSSSLNDKKTWDAEKNLLFEELRKNGLLFSNEEFENFLYSSIEGREYSKFIFTKNLSKSLDYLIEFGNSFELDRNCLSHLPLSSFYDYQKGIINDINLKETFSKISLDSANQRNIENLIELPLLITSKEDFFAFKEPKSKPNYIGTKTATAEIIELKNIKDNLLVNCLKGKIVLIENADPGYDWIFAGDIYGLITMYGGGNSHMAIRAAEFELPAAIGVGISLYKKLSLSNLIELDCNKKTIKLLR